MEEQSTIVRYQQQFRLNVSNLAFVYNFGYIFSISFGTSRSISNVLLFQMLRDSKHSKNTQPNLFYERNNFK